MIAIISTLATMALFAVFIIIATFLGLFAWWIIILAVCAWILVGGFTLVVGVVAVFARSTSRDDVDAYSENPFGDVPKVPHEN